MEQRVMVVQTTGELIATVCEALNQQIFSVKYVEGFDNARKNVIDTRPDLILIDISSWAKNVEEFLCGSHGR
jgi:DNA-binding response OmpR family regulator